MSSLIRLLSNSTPPIWLMRQAGRYLPEYRKIRVENSFLNMCYTPEIAAEVTMQPIRRFDFDAAIIFSDILLIPQSLGLDLNFIESTGPVLSTILNQHDFEKLNPSMGPAMLTPVYEAISLARKMLQKSKSLIGFAGGVWTLMSYMIEGNSSKNFVKSKVFIEENKATTKNLKEVLINAISNHLIAQIKAGADTVQIFDSWAGFLAEDDYQDLIIEPTQEIVRKVKRFYPNVPIVGFPRSSSFFYETYAKKTGVDIMSIDQFVPLNVIREKLQDHVVVQGNLDPRCLLCSSSTVRKNVLAIKKALGEKKFIFNLGHGVLPATPIENVEYLVKTVREL